MEVGSKLDIYLSFLIFLSSVWASGKPWQTMHRQFCWKHSPKVPSYGSPEAAPGRTLITSYAGRIVHVSMSTSL